MKKYFRGIMALLLVSLLLGGNVGYASALELTEAARQATVRYSNLLSSHAAIEINQSTGKVTCSANATSRIATDTLKVTMTLQKLSGNTWDEVKTWTNSGSEIVSMSKTLYIAQAGSYRVISSTDVYNSAGNYVESGSATSKTVSFS